MALNRAFFDRQATLTLFDGTMNPRQKAGIKAILDRWENDTPADDDRWLAYMLATTHHETGRTMQPVRETFADTDEKAIARLETAFRRGRLPWVSKPYWRRDADGKSWLGRGFVQLTHKHNYEKMETLTGLDLTTNPDAVMRMDVALAILFLGMRNGSFTGRRLSQYFSGAKEQWRNARAIINDHEKADLVASFGIKYYACMSYTT